ncbi:MAG: EamA family transporter [Actinomycetota bacterium]
MPASDARSSDPLRPASSGSIWAALVTVWIVWGTTYLAIRVVNQSIPPLIGASLRFLTAGAILYLWTVRRGDRTGDRPTLRQWRSALIIGTLLVFGGNGLVSLAEDTIPSGLAALLVAVVPLWLALFDRLLFGKRLRPVAIIGLITGFGGAALLAGGSIAGDISAAGIALVVLATLLWTFGSLFARRADLPKRPLVGAGMEMLCGGAVQLAVGVVIGELGDLHPETFSAASLSAVAYLIVFGSIVAFSCYVWLIRSAPTSLVATYAYVNPVVAVTLGAIILSEPLEPRTLIAGAIIVVSVALIVSGQRPAPTDEEREEVVRAASGE